MSRANRSLRREEQLLSIHKDRARIEAAAVGHGFALTIRNQLQHWVFERKGLLIEWWPGSGKVAVDKDFDGMQRADSAGEIIALLDWHRAPAAPAPPERRPPIAPGQAIAAALAGFDFDRAGTALRRKPEALRQLARTLLDGCRRAPGSTVVCGGLTVTRGDDGTLSLRMTNHA